MDWLFKPLATSNYLVAVANLVALATASYFAYRSVKWFIQFGKSVYQNRVKEFLKLQRQSADHVAQICVELPSYFIAVIVRHAVIITIGVIMLITNTIRMNAIHTSRYGPESSTLPMWVGGDGEYNLYSISTGFFFFISFIYLNSLMALSTRVRRKIRTQISTQHNIDRGIANQDEAK